MHLNDKKVPKLLEDLIIFSGYWMTSLSFYQLSHLKILLCQLLLLVCRLLLILNQIIIYFGSS